MTKRSTKRCLFCDAQGKLTGEHSLGRWAFGHIDAEGWRTGFSVSRPATFDGRVQVNTKVRDQTGHPARQQIRSVCEPCNNGWMSRLQSRAAPVALPFVKGAFPPIDEQAAASMAAWAVMATMNYEHRDPPTAMVPAWQRRELMDTETVPKGWFVGIARFAGNRPSGAFWHRSMNLGAPLIETGENVLWGRVQLTIFPLGKLLIHTISADSKEAFDHVTSGNVVAYSAKHRLRPIWPFVATSMPAEHGSIDDAGLAAIMNQFAGPVITGFRDPPIAGGPIPWPRRALHRPG